MTDQPSNSAAQPQQPPIVVVSASDLVSQAIKRIPALAQVQSQLQLVFGVFVQFVESPTGQLPLADAQADLEAFFETNPDGVRKAVVDINRIIASESVAIAAEFKDMTGAEIDPKTLDIAGRVQEEIEEQRGLDKVAREFLAQVQAVVAKLGIRNLYAEKNQQTAKPEPKQGLLAGVQGWALKRGYLEEKQVEQVHEPEPDWLTSPIISADSPDVARIKAKLEAISRQMARFASQSNMKELVLASLANLGMPTPELEKLLEHASDLAYRQLEQSGDILADVDADKNVLTERIDAINDVKEIYVAVLRYFFPG